MITCTKRLSWDAILSRLASSRRLTEAERDACAAGVDKCSELGATVDEGRDFIDVIVDEVGAPDGESLIRSIRDLKARAGERDSAIANLEECEKMLAIEDARLAEMRAVLTEEGIHECDYDGHTYSVVERIEMLAKRCEFCEELESRPIHPALVRLAEAARAWAKSLDESPQHHPTVREMCAAIRALPSPLPTVVTCGECRFNFDGTCRASLRPTFSVPSDGFCHLGKRRVS